MSPPEVQALLYGLIGGIISVAGTAIAISNWLNGRFNQLFVNQEKLNGRLETLSNREASNNDHAIYLWSANKELIEHRTKRFTDELNRLKGELEGDVRDIKNFLDKTTEFTIRGRGRDSGA